MDVHYSSKSFKSYVYGVIFCHNHVDLACPAGTYLSPSNGSCSSCPANSVSETEGLAQCTCVSGHYRATTGEEDLPCRGN